MVGTLSELNDSAAAGRDSLIHEASDEIGRMVAGFDEAKAASVSAKVSEWLKANREANDATDDAAARQASLEQSARKMLGDVSPIEVLNHWLEDEAALLVARA